MTASKFIKSHLSTLEHFLEQGAYPLRIFKGAMEQEEAEEICASSLSFFIKDGYLMFDRDKKIEPAIMAEFYKFKYLESQKELNRISKIAYKFAEELQS